MAERTMADALDELMNSTDNGIKAKIEKLFSFAPEDLNTAAKVIAAIQALQSREDTTYSTGTATTEGLTKLYTATGSATDGTMTQSAITNALNDKLNKTDAATTYLTKTDASSTYLTQTNASSTYATKTELSNVSVNDSNYAKLNAENTFSQNQNFGTSDILLRNMKIRGTNMGGRIYSKGRFFLEADSDSFVLLPNCTDIGQTTSDTSGTLYFGSDSSPCSITWDTSAKTLTLTAANGVYANNTKIG